MSLLADYEQQLARQAANPPASTLLTEVQNLFPQTHGPDETVYQEYLNQNRPHQTAALDALRPNTKGQVIIPTGTGKTRVQVGYLVGDMFEKEQENHKGTYVIASHRLLLNKQLMDEFQDLCIKCHLPINVLYVGSAQHDDKEVYDKYFSQGISAETFKTTFTTRGSEVKAFSDETRAANRHLIVVSTYHSFEKLNSLDAIDVCCYDEAHNTTNEDFSVQIKIVQPKIARNFFFTATRKICILSGHGMENEEVYGNVLYKIPPKTMVALREIVTPRIITMMLDNDTPKGVVSDKNQHMLVKTIIEAFKKNQEQIRLHSANPDAMGTKLLVSFVGSDELALVQESEEFREWAQQNNIRVFAFSSRHGSFSNFEEKNRDKAYEDMQALQDTDNCVFLHIDILAEGINLPSITGVVLLRHLNEIKLFQTLGRALRLMKIDRQRLYSGELSPNSSNGFLKPYAYLILPTHFQDMDTSSEDMKRTIQDVITTYGIPVEDFLPPEGFKTRDVKGLSNITDSKKISRMKKDYPLLSVVEDFIIESFSQGLPEDPHARYEALMNILSQGDD